MEFVLEWVENIVGKGENAGIQHFLLFKRCFQKAFSSTPIKLVILWETEDNQLVIFYMKNISRGCVVRR